MAFAAGAFFYPLRSVCDVCYIKDLLGTIRYASIVYGMTSFHMLFSVILGT